MPRHLTKNYLRVRKASPGKFVKGSFRTKTLSKKGTKGIFARERSSGKYKLQAVLYPRVRKSI